MESETSLVSGIVRNILVKRAVILPPLWVSAYDGPPTHRDGPVQHGKINVVVFRANGSCEVSGYHCGARVWDDAGLAGGEVLFWHRLRSW